MNDETVWSVESTGEGTRLLTAPEGARIASISAAPDVSEVAALITSVDETQPRSEVVVLEATGKIVRRLRAQTAMATPDIAGGTAATAVDWSPQGDRLLLAFDGGGILELPAGGEGESQWLFTDEELDVLQPRWSPTGDRVAFIAVEADRRRTLKVLDVETGTTTDIVGPSDARAVVEFDWAADGASILFTESGIAVGAVSGVDLWQVDATGVNRELVASAGSVAPVARIADLSPSPDGRSVAYAVLVPGETGPRFDSVWVRNVDSRQGFRLDLPTIRGVNEIWWVDTGLLVEADIGRVDGDDGGESVVLRVDATGDVETLWVPPDVDATPVSGQERATPTVP